MVLRENIAEIMEDLKQRFSCRATLEKKEIRLTGEDEYSFLIIIALVTILNIVNSISMSVSARIKQYGAMRAVGMSKKQLGNMVKAETRTYSCLGCAIGLIIGLLFSKWLYGFLVTSHYAYATWHLPVAELAVIGHSLLCLLQRVSGHR